jgi:hypothetical protein
MRSEEIITEKKIFYGFHFSLSFLCVVCSLLSFYFVFFLSSMAIMCLDQKIKITVMATVVLLGVFGSKPEGIVCFV